MIRHAALGLLLIGAATHSVAAQALPEVRFEAGIANLRQPGLGRLGGQDASDAALFGVFWRRPTDTWTLYTSANLSYAGDSLAAAQGVAAASFPWSKSSPHRTDIGISGASFSLRSAGTGGNGNGFFRQHYVRDNGGAWFGGTAATTLRRNRYNAASAADIGLWGRYRFLYASASLSRLYATDQLLFETAGLVAPNQPGPYEIQDGQLVLQLRGGPHDITGSWTRRRAIAGADFSQNAYFATATLQLTDRVAAIGGIGRQLADPVRGLPEAEVVTASLRVSLGPKPLPVMQRSTIAEVSIEPMSGGGAAEVVVRVFSIESLEVEIAGDFSEWKPIPMEREGSYWVARTRLRSGKYFIGVRTNQGPWRAPRNLARVRDDFGGESGIIVIP